MTSFRVSTLSLASVFIFFTFLVGAKAVSAATITVDALTNTGGAGCELREAILSANTDAAVGGCTSGASGLDTIVFSGSGTVDISNQDLPNITSIVTMDGGSDIIVDSNTTSRRIFTVSGTTSTTFVLSNITLQRGRQVNGGCISMEDAAGRSLTLTNVTFTDCRATGDGGAIYMPTGAGSVEMISSTFTSSSAASAGGALWAGSGTYVTSTGVTAFKNRAGTNGGAFYTSSSAMTANSGALYIANSTFESNTSTALEGGGAVNSAKLLNVIHNSTFKNNYTFTPLFRGGAAGLFKRLGSTQPLRLDITSSSFIGNIASSGNGGGNGSVFYINGQNGSLPIVNISDSLMQNNYTDYGTLNWNTSTSSQSTITRSLFLNNTVVYDGALIELNGGLVTLTNSLVQGNRGTDTGGGNSAINMYAGSMDIFNNTFIDNSASSTYLGGIYTGSVFNGFGGASSVMRFANNIFEKNYDAFGYGWCKNSPDTPITIISLGNNFSTETINATCDSDPTDIIGGTAQLGALQNNGGPTLSRLPADNSIVVNAANSTYSPSVDQRGFARPQGAGYDIGATDISDTSAPILAQVAPISTPQSDLTPDFSFTTNQAGTISYPGTCSSVTVQATSGTNAITFNTLTSGTRYDNCQIRVTDSSGNGTTLTLTAFETTGAPGTTGGSSSGGGGLGSAGTVAIPPTETTFQTNLQNLQNQGVSVHGLIKIPSNSAVYYVGADGKRHAFPNDKVYFTWYENFDGVQLVNEAQLSSIPLGKNVTYKPGKKMVKFTTDAKVYVVAKGGILRGITTEAAATELYGSNWNTQIDDISDAFYTNYTFGAEVSGLSDFNPTTVQASVQFPSDSLQM